MNYRFYHKFDGVIYWLTQDRLEYTRDKHFSGLFHWSDWLDWGQHWDLRYEELTPFECMRANNMVDMFEFLGLEG